MQNANLKHVIFLDEDGYSSPPPGFLYQINEGENITFCILKGCKVSCSPIMISDILLKEGLQKIIEPLNMPSNIRVEEIQNNISGEDKRYTIIYPQISLLGDYMFNLELNFSGNYFFQIEYYNYNQKAFLYTLPIYILIQPFVTIKQQTMPITCLRIQTVIGRCLGLSSRWANLLREQIDIGYNAFHFVPLQKYGGLSHFCIMDQLDVDPFYFSKEYNKEQRISKFEMIIKQIQEDCVGIIDIVLHHTSIFTPWILDHQECTYNTISMPYLKVAYELDCLLQQFSIDFSKKNVEECPFAPFLSDEKQLVKVLEVLKNKIENKQFFEYFQIDISKYLQLAESILKEKKIENEVNQEYSQNVGKFISSMWNNCLNLGEERFGVNFDTSLIKYFRNISDFETTLKKINEMFFIKVKGFINEIIKNIEKEIIQTKFEKQSYLISNDNPLLKPYFSSLSNNLKVAHDGWSFEDFTNPKLFSYFRRTIHIWRDCVKLFYGNRLRELPFLWDHMEEYITWLSRLFKGIRIHNAHGIPIFVLQYFIKKARNVNPNLIVLAELFTGDQIKDVEFVSRTGINALVRESFYCNDAPSFVKLLKEFGNCHNNAINMVNSDKYNTFLGDYENFKPSRPLGLIYDITHDNQSPYEIWKNNNSAILPIVCGLSFTNTLIGSSRGVDEFYQKSISVVTESRQYSLLNKNSINEDKIDELYNNSQKMVTFYYYDMKAISVNLALSTNEWKDNVKLEKETESKWSVSIWLPKGIHYYKFVADGIWKFDPSQPHEPDEKGNINNFIVVTSNRKNSFCSDFDYNSLCPLRKVIFDIHQNCNEEMYALQVWNEDDILIMVRLSHNSNKSCVGYALISRTAFTKKSEQLKKVITLPCSIKEIIVTVNMYIDLSKNSMQKNLSNILKGIPGTIYCHKGNEGLKHFGRFKNNIIEIFKMPTSLCIIASLQFDYQISNISRNISIIKELFIPELSMSNINYLLFRCKEEEKSINKSDEVLLFENHDISYAGFAYLKFQFKNMGNIEDINRPIFKYLCQENWLIKFYLERLSLIKELNEIYDWFNSQCQIIIHISPELRLNYISKLVNIIYLKIEKQIIPQTNTKLYRIACSSEFCYDLIFSCYQFYGLSQSKSKLLNDSLSVGLPINSIGLKRMKGINTFQSMRGILLINHRFSEARQILIDYAKTFNKGLISEYIEEEDYNCESIFYFLYCIEMYIKSAHDESFLSIEISLFSGDVLTIRKMIIEILKNFIEKICIRSINQTIEIGLDKNSGLIYFRNVSLINSVENKKRDNHDDEKRIVIDLNSILYKFLLYISELSISGLIDLSVINQIYNIAEWVKKIKIHFNSAFFRKIDNIEIYNYFSEIILNNEGFKNKNSNSFSMAKILFSMIISPDLFNDQGKKFIEENALKYFSYYLNEDKSTLIKENLIPEIWEVGLFIRSHNIFFRDLNLDKKLSFYFSFLKPIRKCFYENNLISLPRFIIETEKNKQENPKAYALSVSSILECLFDLIE